MLMIFSIAATVLSPPVLVLHRSRCRLSVFNHLKQQKRECCNRKTTKASKFRLCLYRFLSCKITSPMLHVINHDFIPDNPSSIVFLNFVNLKINSAIFLGSH